MSERVTLCAVLLAVGCDRATPDASVPHDSAPATVIPPIPDGATAAGPDPSCTANGCLRSATKIGDYPAAQLRVVIDPRVTIENGYSVWAIEYMTAGRASLATVTIPYGIDPSPRGWAIVANNHGTVGLDDACKLTGTVLGAALAGLFGARAMIGVATDYPGLGTPGTLPYLVSEVEGKAALDALRAARDLASWQGVRVSQRYAIAGLSEGGHATLAAAALHAHYAPELDIRAFAAAAPASVYEEYWRAGFVDGPLVPFHAMLVHAWATHYATPSPWAPGAAQKVRATMLTACVGIGGSTGGLADLGTARAQLFSASFTAAYESGRWGDFETFREAFATNRIVPYVQTAPLKIYQGDADTIVPELGTRALVEALRTGGVEVDYEVVPGATHFDLAFGLVGVHEHRTAASIAWLASHLERN